MKSNILSIFLLTAILSLAVVSAAANFTLAPTSLKFVNADNSKTFTITPSVANLTYHFAFPTILDKDNAVIPFTPIADLLIPGTTATTITVNSAVNYDKLNIGETYTGNLVITDTSDSLNTNTLPITFIKTFCDSGEKGNATTGLLEITEVSIDNADGDDTEWSPLDPITVEVKVENTGDDKLSDVIVELGLYNSEGDNIINDMKDLDNEQVELGSIREDDDDTATFNFKVPADFEDETYILAVKTYSDDTGEDEVCTSYSTDLGNDYYESIDGTRETDEENHIVVDNIKVSPENPQCSEMVQVSAEVFNIGDEDYEDQVKVTLINKDLGVNLEKIIRQDFDQGDSESVDFEFEIPADAEKKAYVMEFRTYYDYDSDDEVYNIVSDDRFTETLTVEGNCGVVPAASSVKITAKLSSDTPEAIAGEQVIITATLQNTGDTTDLYAISVSGNSAWSSLSEINPESVIIPAGQSKEVDIVLDIDAEAEGDKQFTIKATKDGKTTEQSVLLSITEKTPSGITGSAVLDHIKANGFIYVIVLINLILIIAIILVIRRMISPKASI